MVTVGGQVVAAERAYGSGRVTLLGFDPAADLTPVATYQFQNSLAADQPGVAA